MIVDHSFYYNLTISLKAPNKVNFYVLSANFSPANINCKYGLPNRVITSKRKYIEIYPDGDYICVISNSL